MLGKPVTAAAHPNLALVKYWGKADEALNIPTNSSISVNLGGATTITTVRFDPELKGDCILINGQIADPAAAGRVSRHLDHVREMAALSWPAAVESRNDFPTSAGIASSASAFAALALAASRAAGVELDDRQLSILARRGSGSACRSIHGGWVEWVAGSSDKTSFARQIAPPDFWDIRILSVVLDGQAKAISSSAGHRAAWSSPFFLARLAMLPRMLSLVREALLTRDFDSLALVVEREAVSMHSIAMTGRLEDSDWLSGLYYWRPETLALVHAVQAWRKSGIGVCFTIDAGPNIHLLCEGSEQAALVARLDPLLVEMGASTISSRPGGGAWIVE